MHSLSSPLYDSHDAFVWMVIRDNMNTPPQKEHIAEKLAGRTTKWARMKPEDIADITLGTPARVKKSLLKLEQGGAIESLKPLHIERTTRYRVKKV